MANLLRTGLLSKLPTFPRKRQGVPALAADDFPGKGAKHFLEACFWLWQEQVFPARWAGNFAPAGGCGAPVPRGFTALIATRKRFNHRALATGRLVGSLVKKCRRSPRRLRLWVVVGFFPLLQGVLRLLPFLGGVGA